MAISLVASAAIAPTGSAGTTGAFDSTGATLLVACATYFGAPTITDNKGNTWTALSEVTSYWGMPGRMYYCANPVVGSGHTVSTSGGAALQVAAFAGVATATPLDQQAHSASSSSATTTHSVGPVTPTDDGELLVVWNGTGGGALSSVNSSFSVIGSPSNNVPYVMYGCGLAWKEQATAAAETPTMTLAASAGGNIVGGIVSFLAGAASGPPTLSALTISNITATGARLTVTV